MPAPNLTTIAASHAAAARICLLDRRPREALRAQLQRNGVWWIDPCGGIVNTRVLGQALVPGPHEAGDALVDSITQMGTTVVSAPSRLVPILLYRQRLVGNPRRWTELRSRWPTVRAPLEALHAAFGGSSLQEFQSILFDDRLQAADTGTASGDRRAAQRDILRRIDPDPSRARFLAFLHAAESDPWTAIPDGLGPWSTAALGRAFALRSTLDQSRPDTMDAAWRLLHAAITVDGAVSEPLTPLHATDELRVSLRLTEAARIAMNGVAAAHEGWDRDPWVPAIRALAQEGLEYSGLAHMEVAAALDGMGRPQEAWTALISAAHWTQVRTRTIVPAVREAAKFLAETHGWEGLSRLLSE
jgi:hypothetical protein